MRSTAFASKSEVHCVLGFDYDGPQSEKSNRTPIIPGVTVSHLIPDWIPEVTNQSTHQNVFQIAQSLMAADKATLAVQKTLVAELFERYDWDFIHKTYTNVISATENLLDRLAPEKIILPEESDYIRGALAQAVAWQRGIPTEVYFPSYYNRIASYPSVATGRSLLYHMNSPSLKKLLATKNSGIHEKLKLSPDFETCSPPLSPESRPRTVVVALQNSYWEDFILRDLVDVTRNISAVRIIVRQHPRSPNRTISDFLTDHPEVEEDTNPHLDLNPNEIGCVISQTSTMLMTAKKAGIFTIAVNYGGFPDELFAADAHSPDIVVHDKQELAIEILKSLPFASRTRTAPKFRERDVT